MDNLLDAIATKVRWWMLMPARFLNAASGGRLTPNHITLIALLGHFWIFWELNSNHPIRAGLLLIVFGLMDSLDGALSRVQKSGSPMGMLYDSVSDRLKEVLLYSGIVLFLYVSSTVNGPDHDLLNFYYSHSWTPASASLLLPVAVCGMSVIVSYIRARGENVLQAAGKHSTKDINKLFTGGIARYEIRTVLLVIGLLTGSTLLVLHLLFVLLILTATKRLLQVRKALSHV
jgi:phosphatidylglycerophosphate synthase